MTRYYATLFDSAYASKGLALYQSLIRHSSDDFVLIVLAMDAECERVLRALKLEKMVVVSLPEFEKTMGMAPFKANRTWAEFCWTCASSLCAYILYMWNMESATYLDSDIFFFSDPKVVFDEIGEKSIGIVPHRFAPEHRERLLPNGEFNVSLVFFRKNAVGMTCIDRWNLQCREWCKAENEDGKFGDQGYLNSWPADYGEECHVIGHIGVGVAPWNISAYDLAVNNESQAVGVFPRDFLEGSRLVMYHYHELKEIDGMIMPTNYELSADAKRLIYEPYIREYRKAKELIASVESLSL